MERVFAAKIVTMFAQHNALYQRLKSVGEKSPLYIYVETVNRKPTQERIQALTAAIVDQWHYNPAYMDRVLGFDLQKVLNVKLYTVEKLNYQFSQLGYAYRVLESTTSTDKTAKWTARADYFSLQDGAGTVYVDSRLNRYIRLSNGQMFRCSNTDLLAMPDRDKTNTLSYLTGLID